MPLHMGVSALSYLGNGGLFGGEFIRSLESVMHMEGGVKHGA